MLFQRAENLCPQWCIGRLSSCPAHFPELQREEIAWIGVPLLAKTARCDTSRWDQGSGGVSPKPPHVPIWESIMLASRTRRTHSKISWYHTLLSVMDILDFHYFKKQQYSIPRLPLPTALALFSSWKLHCNVTSDDPRQASCRISNLELILVKSVL